MGGQALPVCANVDTANTDVAYILSMEWQRSAGCLGMDGEMWFPSDRTCVEAKRICNMCSVRKECLEYSLLTEQEWGLWGGIGQRQRRRTILKRRVDPSTT